MTVMHAGTDILFALCAISGVVALICQLKLRAAMDRENPRAYGALMRPFGLGVLAPRIGFSSYGFRSKTVVRALRRTRIALTITFILWLTFTVLAITLR
jgi:hypothetical protein